LAAIIHHVSYFRKAVKLINQKIHQYLWIYSTGIN